MSAYIGAVSITDKRGVALRLQIHPQSVSYGRQGIREARYRCARLNGWHCGHWHRTPEDAVACATAKGEPMD